MVVHIVGVLFIVNAQLVTGILRGPIVKSARPRSSLLSAQESQCKATVYSVGANDDDKPGKFILPPSEVGKEEVRPCIFKGASYKEGEMKFKCKDRGWALTGHTCKGRAAVKEQCGYTTHKLTMHESSGEFLLPLANPGDMQDAQCNFFDEHYLEGKVLFKCSNGKWVVDSNTCSKPASGRCPPTNFGFKLNGHKLSLDLPKSENDSISTQDCSFADKKYKHGKVQFSCQDAVWKYKGHSCTDQPVGGCAATEFTVKLSERSEEFSLPNIEDGEKKEFSCKFKDKVYDGGVVKFACEEGFWSYTGHTCVGHTQEVAGN